MTDGYYCVVCGKFLEADAKPLQALRARLAQPEPAKCDGGQCGIGGYCKQCPKTQHELEPVAWADAFDIEREGHDFWVSRQQPVKNGVPLYIAPKREWVGLTEAERLDILDAELTTQSTEHFALAQAIEATLKEKNT